MNRHEESLAAYDRILRIDPDDALALFNRGNVLQQLNRLHEAIASYERARTIQPDFAEACIELSHCKLALGDFAAAGHSTNGAGRRRNWHPTRIAADKPMWRGDASLQDKTILLWAEQGLGDTIQFARYAVLVAALAREVVLRVPTALKAIMASMDDRVRLIDNDDPLPPHDFQCPLMSLPLAFERA